METIMAGARPRPAGHPVVLRAERMLDVDARTAVVSPATVDWYTQAKKETATEIVEPLRTEHRLGLELVFGRVSVTERVIAYQRTSSRGGGPDQNNPPDPPRADQRARDGADEARAGPEAQARQYPPVTAST